MTARIASGLAFALVASLALNTGFLLQHRGNADAPAVDIRRPLGTLVSLLRRRTWLFGIALGTGGWALHVAALWRAPLSLVQAFVAGGLALLAPVATRWFGQRLQPAEYVSVAVMGLGLAGLVLGLPQPHELTHPGAGLGAFLAGCVLLAAAVSLRRSPLQLAVAAGLLYGAADTAIKTLTIVVGRDGGGAVAAAPWVVAAVVATAGAFFAFQRALQIGRPVTAIALMTAATYAVSIAAGVALLGEPLGHGVTGAVHAVAFAAVVAAAWVLAPVQARVTAA